MATSSTSTDGNLSVIWSAWRSSILLQIMFSNGLIANLILDKLGNIEKVTFDKVSKKLTSRDDVLIYNCFLMA
jgi:hypothetical protein